MSIGPSSERIALRLSDEGPMLETLDYTIRIGSIPTFLYFDLYLYILITWSTVQLFINQSQLTIRMGGYFPIGNIAHTKYLLRHESYRNAHTCCVGHRIEFTAAFLALVLWIFILKKVFEQYQAKWWRNSTTTTVLYSGKRSI